MRERHGINVKYIFTDFFTEFACVGGSCIDTCCKDWTIFVDKATYGRYMALEEPLRSQICSHIEEKEEQGNRKIILDGNGRCPFLNDRNLCEIYRLVSPDAMGGVCQIYPRNITQYYDVVMATLMLSCPEAARMVVEKQEPIGFRFTENQEEYVADNVNWTLYNELINGLVIATDILQDRALLLWQRFQLLLIETKIVQEHIKEQDFLTLRDAIECLRDKGYREKMYAGRRTNPMDGMKKWNFIYGLFEAVISCKTIREGPRSVLEKFRAIARGDEETYRVWNREFTGLQSDVVYENVAVQCMFEYYMDALTGKSLYVNIVKMLIFLTLIRTVDMIGYHTMGGLTAEDRAYTISNISRVVEHSSILDDLASHIVDSNEETELFQLISIFG